MYNLYADAVSATRAARDARVVETDDDFIEKVTAARNALFRRIMTTAKDNIMTEARRGMTQADLFAFNGNDFVDSEGASDHGGVSVLFLIKGQRPMTCIPKHTPGPLLPDLQRALEPFEIVHDWDGITGGNRIVARWKLNSNTTE